MTEEQVAGALTMAALGLGLSIVGLAARRGRLQLALGGWTPDTATAASWSAAHRVIGTWFAAAGGVALACALAIALSPSGWIGAWVGSASVVLLAVVVIGVVRGTNRLEPSATGDL